MKRQILLEAGAHFRNTQVNFQGKPRSTVQRNQFHVPFILRKQATQPVWKTKRNKPSNNANIHRQESKKIATLTEHFLFYHIHGVVDWHGASRFEVSQQIPLEYVIQTLRDAN